MVLDPDKSCHNAVSKVIAYLSTEGVEIPSTNTSAYCQARSRLPEKLLEKLFSSVGQKLEEQVIPEYLWCSRHVKVIDGSSVSMPDTVENQKAYPQPKSQKLGCGFPIAKISNECGDKKLSQPSYLDLDTQVGITLKQGWLNFSSFASGVIFSLAYCAAIALTIDVLNTHDLTLSRKLYEFLKPNDILLGDRAS